MQVISDVDDTLKSSGGVKAAGVALGGIDTQYVRGDFYPGVFEFMFQISMHPVLQNSVDVDVEAFQQPPAKVAVLTARAEEFKAALELKDSSKLAQAFKKTGQKSGIQSWGLGPVLYGSVAEWVVQDRKGLRKFSNFERLIQQDNSGEIMEYAYVGDTGELDQEAGETMLREYPELVKCVFLHVVSETPKPKIPPPKLINGRPLVFFRTYVGAACKATQLGLMGTDGLQKVVDAAIEALVVAGVPKGNSKWIDLQKDLAEASRTCSILAP